MASASTVMDGSWPTKLTTLNSGDLPRMETLPIQTSLGLSKLVSIYCENYGGLI